MDAESKGYASETTSDDDDHSRNCADPPMSDEWDHVPVMSPRQTWREDECGDVMTPRLSEYDVALTSDEEAVVVDANAAPSAIAQIGEAISVHNESASKKSIGHGTNAATGVTFALDALPMMGGETRQLSRMILDLARRPEASMPFPSTEHGKAYSHISESRMKRDTVRRNATWVSEAEAAGLENAATYGYQIYRDRYHETGGLIYHVSRLFSAAGLQKVKRDILDEKCDGILLVRSGQGDEAQKKLRVDEPARPQSETPAIADAQNCDTAIPPQDPATVTTMAKICYSELRLSMVLQCRQTKRFICIGWELPCGLQAVDRVTAENMVPAQDAVYDLPGLTNDFRDLFEMDLKSHVQDQAGGNERQVYVARQLEKNGSGKPTFRLSFPCEVHMIVRVMSYQLELVYSMVSGLIALSITMQGPSRWTYLRHQVGDRLISMLNIDRL